MSQREHRKKSLIIHGVEMSKSKSLRERIDHDTKYLQTLFKEGMGIGQKVTTRKITRLGKKTDKDRPIKVNMESQNQVREILISAKNLKGKEDYKNISISTDKTPLERAEWKKLIRLREERQAMSDQQGDGHKWIIIGNRVVKERQQEETENDNSHSPPPASGEEGGKWQ